jgi:Leucine-rich repeat (LRR) protein
MKCSSLIVAFSLFAFVSSITLECSYQLSADHLYTCINTNLKVKGSEVFDKVQGNHSLGHNEENVTAVYFLDSSLESFPQNVFSVFKNLSRVVIHGVNLVDQKHESNFFASGSFDKADILRTVVVNSVNVKNIHAKAFENAGNLFNLVLEACGIRHLDKESFLGLKKLQSLSLNHNLIKYLDPEIFKDLTNLHVLAVVGNGIKTITESLLLPLKNIQTISFVANKIEVIDKSAIESLKNLESLYLSDNICVNRNYGTAKTSLSSFDKDVLSCTASSKRKIKRLQVENDFLKGKAADAGIKYKVVEIKADNKTVDGDDDDDDDEDDDDDGE